MSAGAENETLREAARDIPVRHRADVLVVGGGTAGVAAASAAARAGADVMLVERNGYLGGLATGGLIVLLLTLDDGRGRQIIAGLCQEIIDRLDARGAAFHPSSDEWGSDDADLVARDRRFGLVWGGGPHRVRYSVAFEPAYMKGVLDDLVRESGVRLLCHAWGSAAILEERRVRAVAFESKAGRFAVSADIVIDTTGDLDIGASAGCAFESESVLPWMWFTVGGVDVDAAAASGTGFQAIGEGKVLMPWGSIEKIGRIDATSPEDLTHAELECRTRVLREYERLRRDVPGFEHAHLCEVASALGITESRRLIGRRVLTRDDMDQPSNEAIATTGHWTRYGATYDIPYGALQARELDNLLVAGRCISVEHRVHHATKEIPACMATGEAAGVAAALSLETGIAPPDLDVSRLRATLVERGAIVSAAR
ncbi:MAG: FAD-dependent oxidoreductase [bacterium]|nr:FAD-dependent oxidoreductase [bacterium]